MRKKAAFRVIFYVLGLLILALGLTLNTKTGLGVSPIISVAYSISEISGLNFGNMTLAEYSIFVVLEMILHFARSKKYGRQTDAALVNANKRACKLMLLTDFLQIPLSLVFTRFLNVFSGLIPDLYGTDGSAAGDLALRAAVLAIAVILTGIGAAMSLNMRVVPNPGDGIVQAISDCVHRSVGFTKNCFDLINIMVTLTISFVFAGRLVGVGAGTILAMIGVGRSIAMFNRLAKDKMTELAGVEE